MIFSRIRLHFHFPFLLILILFVFSCSKEDIDEKEKSNCAVKYTSNKKLIFQDDFSSLKSGWEFSVDTTSSLDPILDPKGDSSISYISVNNGNLTLSCNNLSNSIRLWAYYPLEIEPDRCFIVLDFEKCQLETDHYGLDDGLDIWLIRKGKRIWMNAYNYGTSSHFKLDGQKIYLSVDYSSYLHNACLDKKLECYHVDTPEQECNVESLFRMGTSNNVDGIYIVVTNKYSAESAFSEYQKMVLNEILVYSN